MTYKLLWTMQFPGTSAEPELEGQAAVLATFATH